MRKKDELRELDLQLYLAGALSLSQRTRFGLALFVSPELRQRLREVKSANGLFEKGEMVRLEAQLFPPPARIFTVTHPKRPMGMLGWAGSCLGSLALLALLVIPIFSPKPSLVEEDYTAKGRGLGINLFVKGDTAYRVENQVASILPSDTLQAIPIGSEPQYLMLLGWDEHQGTVTLFPQTGIYAQRVSAHEPPPALLLQGIADNRLICITATGPFRVQDALKLLGRQPFLPLNRAPASHLTAGRYVQIFSISKKARRI